MTVGNDKKNWLSGYKLETFTLFTKNSGNGGNAFHGQFLFIKYWESVGNTVRVDIICSDTYGFLDSLPIRSGDAIELVITHPSRKEPFEFVAKKKNRLIISDIVGATREAKREMYTLQCVTESTLSNHTTRCPEKYKGKPSDSAKSILKKVLKVDKKRMGTWHDSSNKYDFMGNFVRPIELCNRLAAKSVSKKTSKSSASGGSMGFVFFENETDGYNFISIDEVMGSEPKYIEYQLQTFNNPLKPDNYTIKSIPSFSSSHDIIKKLRIGQYKSANWYFDIMKRTPHFIEFDYSSIKDTAEGDKSVPHDISEKYSRILLNVLDLGAISKKDTPVPDSETIAWRQAHSAARYQSLFSSILDITVPMNFNLKVGTMIDITVPKLNTEDTEPGNSPYSGKWMIAKLSHEFGHPTGDFTGLSLIRDSFSANA